MSPCLHEVQCSVFKKSRATSNVAKTMPAGEGFLADATEQCRIKLEKVQLPAGGTGNCIWKEGLSMNQWE